MAKTQPVLSPDVTGAPLAGAPAIPATVPTAAAASRTPSAEEQTEAKQMQLRKGTFEFAAPGYLGGVRITLTRGETVPAEIWEHVSEADRDLFDTVAVTGDTDAPKA